MQNDAGSAPRLGIPAYKSNNNAAEVRDDSQLTTAISVRHVKLICISVPAGNFSFSGFPVFGKGSGTKPGVGRLLMKQVLKKEICVF